MLYYPQLATGAIAQFPITRRNIRRTIVNTFSDGGTIAMSDDGAAGVGWQLTYADLTDDELASLETLFSTCCGAWQSFTFLDPTDNLLLWSEDLSQQVWEKDPLLSLTAGGADPAGGQAATSLTNTAQAAQQIIQQVAGPAGYQYCFSFFLSAAAPCQVQVSASGAGTQLSTSVLATTAWSRVQFSFQLAAQGDGVTVGIQVPAGYQVSVFGLQMEAQPGAGGYKKTRDRAGVYPASRFDADLFGATATGPNQNSTAIKIFSNVAG